MHFIVCFIVSGYDPNKTKPVHERGKGLFYAGEVFVVEILELSLQGLKELDVVLGLALKSSQFLHLFIEIEDNRLIIV